MNDDQSLVYLMVIVIIMLAGSFVDLVLTDDGDSDGHDNS